MNGNEPAYPCPQGKLGEGLTKRELFAAMAMQGMLSGDGAWAADPKFLARTATVAADRLILELGEINERSA